ncbi:hypothetical protein [Streptomyces nodosus]|uniref:hypothetical protein n=1 Tax=Streptomyces nodosus TaxID=40318 RepID=UPI0011856935|nr:hypothetical protein [Streptomyces nodosus]MBB4792175.1 hypothetical protein [Streptomyces nodosus]
MRLRSRVCVLGLGPNGEGLGSLAGRIQVGKSWTAANRPLYTAVPDVRGDGQPGLWATGNNGDLYTYADIRGAGTVIGTGLQGFRSLN